MGGAAERLGRLGKKMSRIQMLNKRQEIFQNAIDGRLRVQDRASERLQEQIIEEIKELEHTKTEETLQLASQESMTCGFSKMKKKRQTDCRASGNRGRMTKWLGHHQEIGRTGLTGKRRERWKTVSGGWSLKGKRKCRKS